MLEHTFQHLPGIGARKECQLWERGIKDWEQLRRFYLRQRSLFEGEELAESLLESEQAFSAGDINYFSLRLPKSEQYRVAVSFPRQTGFLDIETTGLSSRYHTLTVTGLVRDESFLYSLGPNLLEEVRESIETSKSLITFNGRKFDFPFLRQAVPDLKLDSIPHIDLRNLARRLGYKGGQKQLEQLFGIARSESIVPLRGEQAPGLWYRYTYGDLEAAYDLIDYNRADVVGMTYLFDQLIEQMKRSELIPDFVAIPRFSVDEPEKTSISFDRIPRFTAQPGPKLHFSDLIDPRELSQRPVLGIDLTGSDKRASGVSVIAGATVFTERVFSDEDLIECAQRSGAKLVSIDSPLSLPTGRESAFDDDPNRWEHGITRLCERILKKRGINVYPCLINSMQKLTNRGINLKTKLEQHGFTVIESFPGAAQDIIGLPRKQDGLDLLKKGLNWFGLRGEFEEANISHDEVDAITCSLVGVFYLAGNYEALGDETEGYLIVPELRQTRHGPAGSVAARADEGRLTAAFD